jgi:hypothetical protein
MEKFIEKQNSITLPILIYTVASFFVLFVSELGISLVLFFLFLATTYILIKNSAMMLKVIKVSLFVIFLFLLIISIIGWNFSLDKLQEMIPLGIGLSIVVCTGIVVFSEIPTFQLVKITKLICPGENAIYAVLSGFRTFLVVFNISSKTIIAQKVRGMHKNKLLSIKTYLLNILINFFEFIFDFGNQLDKLEIKNIRTSGLFREIPRNIIFILYLLLAIKWGL